MVALDDGVPRTMTLRDTLECWVNHQINIVTRRTQYRLDRAQHELHINEGLLKAIGLIDEVSRLYGRVKIELLLEVF